MTLHFYPTDLSEVFIFNMLGFSFRGRKHSTGSRSNITNNRKPGADWRGIINKENASILGHQVELFNSIPCPITLQEFSFFIDQRSEMAEHVKAIL